uniref:Uncharacterized protein n=1 Tax=Arundo donax TaxID=35708 RepID=A0A0A8YUH5_ARUDO
MLLRRPPLPLQTDQLPRRPLSSSHPPPRPLPYSALLHPRSSLRTRPQGESELGATAIVLRDGGGWGRG